MYWFSLKLWLRYYNQNWCSLHILSFSRVNDMYQKYLLKKINYPTVTEMKNKSKIIVLLFYVFKV